MVAASAMNVSAANNFVKPRIAPKANNITTKAIQKLTMQYGIAAFYTASYGSTEDVNNYYLILSNSSDTEYVSTSGDISANDAFAACIDLYAANGTSDALVEGVYKASTSNDDMTYDTEYSYILYYDNTGAGTLVSSFEEDITVVKNDDGTYTISTVLPVNGIDTDFIYTGKIPLGASSSSSVYPSIKRDVEVQFTGGCGFYYGNLMENHTGNFIVRLFDCDFATTGDFVATEGLSINAMFFTKYLSEDQTKVLEDGTDTFGRSLERGTIFPGMEVDYSDMTVPYGTYLWEKNSKYSGGYAYGYLTDGYMTIASTEENGEKVYDITIIGTTDLSYSVKATYHGTLTFEDKASYSSGGLISTLTDDVEMDLSPIKVCRAYNGGTYTNQENVTVQSFILDIGSPSGKDSGTIEEPTGVADIIRIEFLCPQGTRQILPGTYSVLDSDYTQYFQPYAARQGYFSKKGNGELVGTRYNHYQTGRWLVFDEWSPAMSGTIGVKVNDDDTYTFNINVKDDGEYYVTGDWTGPMSLMYDPNSIAGVNDITSDANVELRQVADKEFSFSAPVNWTAFSTTGAKVAEGVQSTEVNLSNLSNGIYVLKFNNNTQKVVIK
jgi:hypothetical protein